METRADVVTQDARRPGARNARLWSQELLAGLRLKGLLHKRKWLRFGALRRTSREGGGTGEAGQGHRSAYYR